MKNRILEAIDGELKIIGSELRLVSGDALTRDKPGQLLQIEGRA